MNTSIAAPFHFDGLGRTAQADDAAHIKDMIYAVLFTAPGERVNRPDFGCGLRQLVFEPNNSALAGVTQYMIQASLTRWLGDLIRVEAVDVLVDDSTLTVRLAYSVLATGQGTAVAFTAPAGT